MLCIGGSRTERSTLDSLEWHWTICQYQVCICYMRCSVSKLIFPTATSVDVERVFSKGRLVLSHVRNALSVQSTRALLCLGAWSRMGLVKDKDIMQVAKLPDVKGCEPELDSDWDRVL